MQGDLMLSGSSPMQPLRIQGAVQAASLGTGSVFVQNLVAGSLQISSLEDQTLEAVRATGSSSAISCSTNYGSIEAANIVLDKPGSWMSLNSSAGAVSLLGVSGAGNVQIETGSDDINVEVFENGPASFSGNLYCQTGGKNLMVTGKHVEIQQSKKQNGVQTVRAIINGEQQGQQQMNVVSQGGDISVNIS